MTPATARDLLGSGPSGVVRLWSQRELEPLPWTDCRIYAWLTRAWWAGLRWRGGAETARALVALLRRETGVPERDRDGRSQGLTAADLDRALARVIPWLRDTHRYVGDEALIGGLGRRWVAGVRVWLPDLPARQQRWSGSNAIGHVVTLAGSRVREGRAQVLYVDPLGPWGYAGDWVLFDDLAPALLRAGSSTFCSLMEAGDHMLTTIEVVRAFADGGATARLSRGALKTFRVRPASGDFERVSDVELDAPTTVRVGYVASVTRRPSGGPEGRFGLIVDGPARGRFVRLADLADLTPPDTAEAEAAYQRGLAEGRTATEAEFVAADLPELFERVAS